MFPLNFWALKFGWMPAWHLSILAASSWLQSMIAVSLRCSSSRKAPQCKSGVWWRGRFVITAQVDGGPWYRQWREPRRWWRWLRRWQLATSVAYCRDWVVIKTQSCVRCSIARPGNSGDCRLRGSGTQGWCRTQRWMASKWSFLKILLAMAKYDWGGDGKEQLRHLPSPAGLRYRIQPRARREQRSLSRGLETLRRWRRDGPRVQSKEGRSGVETILERRDGARRRGECGRYPRFCQGMWQWCKWWQQWWISTAVKDALAVLLPCESCRECSDSMAALQELQKT